MRHCKVLCLILLFTACAEQSPFPEDDAAAPIPDAFAAPDAFVPPDAFAPIVPDAGSCAPTTELCDGLDNDCDDLLDEGLPPRACALAAGVCAGARAHCGGGGGYSECSASEYGPDYEAAETLCDRLDNDCDGSTDESCSCADGATQACGSDVGACVEGSQLCASGSWGACSGGAGPRAESCNGLDDDCNGAVDDGLGAAPACSLRDGVCAGATRTCAGVGGWLDCEYGASYEAVESSCDAEDNDCDGTADEGCACTDGVTEICGTDEGACRAGTQLCAAGRWGACTGSVGSVVETCNGVDDDCDGLVDDGLSAPSCSLSAGVCAGATARCGGPGGWLVCGSAEYGGRYQASEVACDGVDNDCDGTADEGCECLTGARSACGTDVGACFAGESLCVDGRWGACAGSVAASAETCNGVDDDCDGLSDEDLSALTCASTIGVCAGSVRTCGGASGWIACGPREYGASYVADEAAAAPASCDGLDNDCDGMVDEGCPAWVDVTIAAAPRLEALSLAVDGMGNPHVVYSVAAWGLVYQAWTGSSWTREGIPLPGTAIVDQVSIALSRADVPHVAFHEGRVLYHAVRAATGWTVRVVDGGAGGTLDAGWSPSIVVDSAGLPRVGYREALAAQVRYSVDRATGGWSAPVTVDTSGGQGLSMQLDSTGAPELAYWDSAAQDLVLTRNVGGAWSVQRLRSTGSVGQSPSFVIDGSGMRHVSYGDATAALIGYSWSATGALWNHEHLPYDALSTVLAVDGTGTPEVTFLEVPSGHLRHARRTATGWSVTTIAEATGLFDFALDAGGDAHVVFFDPTTATLRHAVPR